MIINSLSKFLLVTAVQCVFMVAVSSGRILGEGFAAAVDDSSLLSTMPDRLPFKSGSSKLVQISINHRYLTIHPEDGYALNGTADKDVDNNVWQRISLGSDILVRAVKSCRFLCMNECGYAYSMDVPTKECRFVETFGKNHYTYLHRQVGKKRFYLAMNVQGRLRRTMLREKDRLRKDAVQTSIVYADYNDVAVTDVHCAIVKSISHKLDYEPKKTCENPHKRNPKILSNTIPDPLNVTAIDSDEYEAERGDYTEILMFDETLGDVVMAPRPDVSSSSSNGTAASFVEGSKKINFYEETTDPPVSIHLIKSLTPPPTTTTEQPSSVSEENVLAIETVIQGLLNKSVKTDTENAATTSIVPTAESALNPMASVNVTSSAKSNVFVIKNVNILSCVKD